MLSSTAHPLSSAREPMNVRVPSRFVPVLGEYPKASVPSGGTVTVPERNPVPHNAPALTVTVGEWRLPVHLQGRGARDRRVALVRVVRVAQEQRAAANHRQIAGPINRAGNAGAIRLGIDRRRAARIDQDRAIRGQGKTRGPLQGPSPLNVSPPLGSPKAASELIASVPRSMSVPS